MQNKPKTKAFKSLRQTSTRLDALLPANEKQMSQSPRPLRTEESNRESKRTEEAARVYATKPGARKLVDKGRVIVTSGDRLITTMGNAGSSNYHIR